MLQMKAKIRKQIIMSDPIQNANYPKQVFFLLISVTCLRFNLQTFYDFSYNYPGNVNRYGKDKSLAIDSALEAIFYSTFLFGAFLADNCFGKYKTLMGFLTIGCFFGAVVTIISFIKSTSISNGIGLMGAILTAVGYGGATICLIALIGDQFILPQQQKPLRNFFFIYYFICYTVIAANVFLAKYLSNLDNILGFGIITSIIVSIVILLIIRKRLKLFPPEQNVVVDSVRCIFNAVFKKIKSKEKLAHWLNYSNSDYGNAIVEDIKGILKIIMVLMPFFLCRVIESLCLYGWKKQSEFMNDISSDCNFIFFDRVGHIQSVFVLISLFFWYFVIFYLCVKFKIEITLLRCLGIGGTLLATGLVISGFVNYSINQEIIDYPKEKQSYMRIVNEFNCSIRLNMSPHVDSLEIESLGYKFYKIENMQRVIKVKYEITVCENSTSIGHIFVKEKEDYVYLVNDNGLVPLLSMPLHKHRKGFAQGLTLVNSRIKNLKLTRCEEEISFQKGVFEKSGKYRINNFHKEISISRGALYIIIVDIYSENEVKDIICHEIRPPHQLNALWQIPQYIFYALGLALLEPCAVAFVYTQSPISMKTMMIAMWLVIMTFGDLVYVILKQLDVLNKKTVEYFLFGSLGMIFMVGFIFLAMRYEYVDIRLPNDQEDRNRDS